MLRAMKKQQPDWEAIAAVARELGVKDEAIRKWRERGSVPGRWHLAIIDKSKGAIPPSQLYQPVQA